MLLRVTAAIALLAIGEQVMSGAQTLGTSTPSAGSIGTSTPSAGRIGTSTPPAGRIGTTPPPRGIVTSTPSLRQRGIGTWRPVVPFRVPWFGTVYVDSTWWSSSGVGGIWPAPAPVGADDGRPVGGLQLDVEPRRALVYVDGSYVGIVDSFSGYFHHLDLPAGSHIIEFLAPGYDPLTIEILVTPGQTTTYRGALNRR
jgi:hypothetical protein